MIAAMRLVEKVDGLVAGVAAVACENSWGGKDIKTKVKLATCVPQADEGASEWQRQIDDRSLNSWKAA